MAQFDKYKKIFLEGVTNGLGKSSAQDEIQEENKDNKGKANCQTQ